MSNNMCFGNVALVRNIKLRVEISCNVDYDEAAITKAVKLANKSELKNAIDKAHPYIYKKSIDARDKECIYLIYTVAFNVTDNVVLTDNKKNFFDFCHISAPDFDFSKRVSHSPVVVGFGPAGMFCALALAKSGLNPIVIERGSDVDERTQKVAKYWDGGRIDRETNVQFGEGGAGTFSDGKLLTRISDNLCHYVLEQFVEHGAPKEIVYLAKPHIGTDNLKIVVKNIRNEIIRLGGKVLFNTRFDGMDCDSSGKITSITINNGEKIPCDAVFLCIGHSARDTVKNLMNDGVVVEPKPFSVGVRIEHLQSDIDTALYGKYAGNKQLGASSYTLSKKIGNRAVYSFCMCPGGTVVASASDDGQIVTNGMSFYARDGLNANSAIAVSVDTSDYGNTVNGAIEFQESIERKAFAVGGNDGTAPIQLLGDFFEDKISREPSRIVPTYTGKVAVRNCRDVFPVFICDNLKDGIRMFDRDIKGFSCDDAVLTFPETRTSSPVRIPRMSDFTADGFCNLYPCGEGAGYAGGITSAAVDGLKAALMYIKG